MPELPEVETIKTEIAPLVINRCIQRVDIFDEKPFKNISAADFAADIVRRTILGVDRRGKYLIFDLSPPSSCCPIEWHSRDITLIIHLKMSGALIVDAPNSCRYSKIIFHLDNGRRVTFIDPRRFGSVWLVKDPDTVLNKLGPEPLDANFTADAFIQRLRRTNTPIKAALLDQTILAGVGNMYADEALFVSQIHPERRTSHLTTEEMKRLYNAIKTVLRRAIELKGASTRDYFRPDGRPGNAHLEFSVAHRVGKPCPVCGTPIARIRVRNRGTYYCPQCQRK